MKKILLLGAVVLLAIGVVACNKGKEVENPNEITYYFWEEPTMLRAIERFNEVQDEVRVIPKPIPINDYEVKLVALLTAREDVDVFAQKTQFQMFDHYENGFIIPLDEIDAAKDFDYSPYDLYKESLTIDGHYMALPFRGANKYVYYNKVLFDKAGEPYPNIYVEDNEWTWEKFEEVGERLHQKNKDAYGVNLHIWPTYSMTQSFQDRTKFIDAQGNIDIDQHKDAILNDFKLRKRMEKSGAMWPFKDLKVSKMHYSTAFFGGTVGMLFIGEWFPGMLLNAKEKDLFTGFTWNDWGVVEIPKSNSKDKYFVPAIPTFSHITRFSKKKDAAFKFLKWFAGPGGADALSSNGFLPGIVTDKVKENLKNLFPDEKSAKAFLNTPDEVSPYLYNKYGASVDSLLGNMLSEYLSKDISDEDFLNSLRKKLKQIVAEK